MRWLLGAILVIAIPAQGLAQSRSQVAPPDTLLAFSGVFRIGAAHDVAIVPLRAGRTWVLLLADTQSDALRFLTAAGIDTFTAGPELVAPSPVEWTVTARRQGGVVAAIAMESARTSTTLDGRRIPLDAVPVSIANKSIRLEGLLYRPRGRGGRLPLIALAHGSEEADRYSFGPIPFVLAAHGFAVLAYDKRGSGASTGDWNSAGLEELAGDLAAAIRAVSKRPDIDASRIAVLGTSEGGWVAPLAASRLGSIKAMVAICGGARTKGDAYVHKIRREREGEGASPAAVDSAVREAEGLVAASAQRVARGTGEGFDRRISYDPTADWRKFRGPVLTMGGEADVLESGPEAADWFRRLFEQSGNADATIRLWPRAHHSLLLGVTGEPSEFRTLREIQQLAPGYWDVLLRWLDVHLAR
jgi:alpha-beta hydrolase superfamily lysophospholipase